MLYFWHYRWLLDRTTHIYIVPFLIAAKNKKKVKAFQEAAEKERIEAHQKHAPIKSTIDADDLVSMIREQANQRNQVYLPLLHQFLKKWL